MILNESHVALLGNNVLEIRDAATLEIKATLGGVDFQVFSAEVSCDGKLLLTAINNYYGSSSIPARFYDVRTIVP